MFQASESSHRGMTPDKNTAGCQGGCWPTKLGTPPAWNGYQLKGPNSAQSLAMDWKCAKWTSRES